MPPKKDPTKFFTSGRPIPPGGDNSPRVRDFAREFWPPPPQWEEEMDPEDQFTPRFDPNESIHGRFRPNVYSAVARQRKRHRRRSHKTKRKSLKKRRRSKKATTRF